MWSLKPRLHGIPDGFKTRFISLKPTSYFVSITAFCHLHATSDVTDETRHESNDALDDCNGEVEPIDSWEEEDEAEPEVGDGGSGGGVVLQNYPWGERTLSIAQEVLLEFNEGMDLCAFKTSPRGYTYVRLDKLSKKCGCPSMELIESFSRKYKEILDETGARGEIPHDLALEVSSPGADRLLRVPDDLLRFKDMPMVLSYLEDSGARCQENKRVYFLDSIKTESECCVWKFTDMRDQLREGH